MNLYNRSIFKRQHKKITNYVNKKAKIIGKKDVCSVVH